MAAHERAALESVPVRADAEGGHDPNPTGRLHWPAGQEPAWTPDEAQEHFLATRQYRGTAHSNINKFLRGQIDKAGLMDRTGRPTAEMPHDRVIDLLDDVLERSQLTHDVVVHRGSVSGRGVFGDRLAGNLTGFEWREDGFNSTSADPDIADAFGDGGLVMRILVPAGTGAVQLSEYTNPAGYRDEAEILLQRGLRHRVVADHGIADDGARLLDVEVY